MLIVCSSIPVAMLGSTLLCFGDAFLFIETIAILGDMYPDNGAEAISLYKFVAVFSLFLLNSLVRFHYKQEDNQVM